MKQLIIFDADSIIWTIGYKFRNKKVKNLMLISLNNFIKEVIENSKATHYMGFFGSKAADRVPNFRYAIDSKYKAQRPPEPDWITKWRPVITAEMESKWGFVAVDGLEADDAVAICAKHYKDDYKIIVASVDKDLKQIPNVTYYNYSKHTTEEIDEISSMREFCIQMLSGDSADNIKGLYKIGPIKAKNHLAMCGSISELTWTVIRTYIAHEEELQQKAIRSLKANITKELTDTGQLKGKTDKQKERMVRLQLAHRVDEEVEERMPGGWKAYFRMQYSLLKLLTDAPDDFTIPDPTENDLVTAEDELSENITSDEFMYL